MNETTASSRNRRLIQTFYDELWNPFDFARIPDLLHENVRFRGSLGKAVVGHDGFSQYMDFVRAAFPDFHNEVEEVISEADRAFARLRYSGTHAGSLFDVPPSGRRVRYAGAAVFGFRGERITEVWVLGDLHGLLQQLRSDDA